MESREGVYFIADRILNRFESAAGSFPRPLSQVSVTRFRISPLYGTAQMQEHRRKTSEQNGQTEQSIA